MLVSSNPVDMRTFVLPPSLSLSAGPLSLSLAVSCGRQHLLKSRTAGTLVGSSSTRSCCSEKTSKPCTLTTLRWRANEPAEVNKQPSLETPQKLECWRVLAKDDEAGEEVDCQVPCPATWRRQQAHHAPRHAGFTGFPRFPKHSSLRPFSRQEGPLSLNNCLPFKSLAHTRCLVPSSFASLSHQRKHASKIAACTRNSDQAGHCGRESCCSCKMGRTELRWQASMTAPVHPLKSNTAACPRAVRSTRTTIDKCRKLTCRPSRRPCACTSILHMHCTPVQNEHTHTHRETQRLFEHTSI